MATFMLDCARCGEKFEARSARAKWCSERCRKTAQRHPEQVPAPTTEPEKGGADPSRYDGHPLVVAARRELEQAGVLDTFEGQLALALARRVVNPDESGVSALANQLRQAMTAALGTVPPQPGDDEPDGDEDDPVARAEDELARKRAALAAG
jgi:predicted  nucleic acid-binding Zn-ribbon protein